MKEKLNIEQESEKVPSVVVEDTRERQSNPDFDRYKELDELIEQGDYGVITVSENDREVRFRESDVRREMARERDALLSKNRKNPDFKEYRQQKKEARKKLREEAKQLKEARKQLSQTSQTREREYFGIELAPPITPKENPSTVFLTSEEAEKILAEHPSEGQEERKAKPAIKRLLEWLFRK